jgi:hypothetical protein
MTVFEAFAMFGLVALAFFVAGIEEMCDETRERGGGAGRQ